MAAIRRNIDGNAVPGQAGITNLEYEKIETLALNLSIQIRAPCVGSFDLSR